ncbi:dihydrodipicolinate synthetase [Pseudomassariella vexata]|uniref:Dihydrodipicolinate synthetase n=1 Tax=Pseudomassariella vexata TaxID=1141098 RepID=A0A1Y2EFI2_9PEZI|nr:dihydrodipicolinate synthetase [Pseudomassariella vexata]ORY70331.1 dihydrodipicolinate synthetase [Pseudomassariella vexata]
MSPSATLSNGATNGSTNDYAPTAVSLSSILKPGIYVPTIAFFTPQDTIDATTTQTHAIRLARSGVAGLVTHGSNGEAVHLDHTERVLITRLTRDALDGAGYSHLPLIVGCGAQSTRETIQLCQEAAAAGGTYVLVLPPAYYGGLLTTGHILEHFREVADKSPVPVLIYNYPGACSGLDLSSDSIVKLAEHPNICGVKLTCGNTGKLARVVAGTAEKKKGDGRFLTFGGSVDFVLQTLAVGGHGTIGGLANIAPRACVELMRQWQLGKYEQARKLQQVVAAGDWTAIQGGFISVKVGLQKYYGYGGEPRRPCRMPEGEARAAQEEGFAELVKAERALEK